MNNNNILGIDSTSFNRLVLVLLLAILGIVTFHSYYYVKVNNGVSIGAGVGMTILKNRQKEGFY